MSGNHGFELLSEQLIPELNTHARLFRHSATGAELLSLENDDENKVFSINFRTIPADSTGVAHIMEHSVLSGSEKYPVKEPFVELLKGSLNTFVNALTYPDKTIYPVASQNLQDFYNLMDVYIDAVFHPLLQEHILSQEGWHYELEHPDDPMVYKGVVFNEMKGAYSDPERVLADSIEQSLFPGHPYAFSSGGDPKVIPDLTYQQFKKFHETYYHPSNALIYFWGDDDPNERLRLMNQSLGGFQALKVESQVPQQVRFLGEKSITKSYAAGDENAKSYLTLNWLLPEHADSELDLALTILEHILLGSPASPLRKALIESGLGEDLAGADLEKDMRYLYFSTGLKGIKQNDADNVAVLIDSILAQLTVDGIDPDTIAASINTVEFQLRENNTGLYPRGLFVLLRALRFWLYEQNPFDKLAFEVPLKSIKKRINMGEKYFEDLIQKYLIDNQHRTRVLLIPDPNLNKQQDDAEKAKLSQIQSGLNEQEIQKIIAETQLLKKIQETPDSPEALATIPTLKLENIEIKHKPIPLSELSLAGSRVLFHDLPTNGIFYFDLGFDMHSVQQEYLSYLGLFGRALLEMGTQTEDFVTLAQRIGRDTGGIQPSTYSTMVRDSSRSETYLFLRGKSTVSQTGKLLSIFSDVLQETQFDNQERFRQIVLEEKARREAQLVPRGHIVVNGRLKSKFDEAGWLSEQVNGLDFLFFLRQLVEDIETNWPKVLAALRAIRRSLLDRSKMLCNVTVDGSDWSGIEPQLNGFISNLPEEGGDTQTWEPVYSSTPEGLTIPAQVNYVGKGLSLYPAGYNLHGSISVISIYLGTTWLWERIRVQGGAYGGFSTFDQLSGVFNYLSYRDPNLLSSLKNYEGTGQFLRSLDLSPEELSKSVIGAIGRIDGYMFPDTKGFTSMQRYLTDQTDEFLQNYRDQVLSTTKQDFVAFGELLDGIKDDDRVVVLGALQGLSDANDEMGGDWIDIQKVV